MFIQQFFVDGLGCASYLIGCEGQGVAAVVDPDRDVQKYLEAAQARGLTITHIIETHLHADHVSGNADLAEQTAPRSTCTRPAAHVLPINPCATATSSPWATCA